MLTMVNVDTNCHHMKKLKYYHYIPYVVFFIPVTYLFYKWKFVSLSPSPISHIPHPFPYGKYQFVPCI